MNTIADFTAADRWIVETALKERYEEPVALQLADSETRLDPDASDVTLCPTFYWEAHGIEFVIFKVADHRYRSQFYYSAGEQFGTGRDFDDLAECASVTLKLQADHEKDRAGATSGKTGADFDRN